MGKAATKVVVQNMLTMVGGLIESASRDEHGNLTRKGEAQVKAGNLIVETLHDFDQGMTLGLGLNPVSTSSDSAFGSEVRTKFAFKNKERDVYSALVGLQVTTEGEIIGSENLRDTSEQDKMEGMEMEIDLDVTFATVNREQTPEEIEFRRNRHSELIKEIHKKQEEIMQTVREESKR